MPEMTNAYIESLPSHTPKGTFQLVETAEATVARQLQNFRKLPRAIPLSSGGNSGRAITRSILIHYVQLGVAGNFARNKCQHFFTACKIAGQHQVTNRKFVHSKTLLACGQIRQPVDAFP